jgi:hypothetical protein
MESSMRSLAVFVVAVVLASFNLFAQPPQEQKTQDKDADKKPAVAVASAGKNDQKKGAKEDKKEEPKKEEEKKPGMNADTFSGLKFRSIGPGAESGRVMSIAGRVGPGSRTPSLSQNRT